MNLKSLFQGKYSLSDKQQLNKFITNGIKSGEVQPLPTTVYNNEKNLEEAFKWVIYFVLLLFCTPVFYTCRPE